MKQFVVVSGLLLAMTAAPAIAFEEPDDEGAVDAYAPDTIRCERIAVTGSRVRRTRICMTNAEWAMQRDVNNRNASGMLANGEINADPNPGVSNSVAPPCPRC